MMWGYAGFGFVAMVLFWGGLIWAIARTGNNTNTNNDRDGRGHAARILEARFARGEIDADEFEARRSELAH